MNWHKVCRKRNTDKTSFQWTLYLVVHIHMSLTSHLWPYLLAKILMWHFILLYDFVTYVLTKILMWHYNLLYDLSKRFFFETTFRFLRHRSVKIFYIKLCIFYIVKYQLVSWSFARLLNLGTAHQHNCNVNTLQIAHRIWFLSHSLTLRNGKHGY